MHFHGSKHAPFFVLIFINANFVQNYYKEKRMKNTLTNRDKTIYYYYMLNEIRQNSKMPKEIKIAFVDLDILELR